MRRFCGVLCLLCVLSALTTIAPAAEKPKKIVLIAGKKSHGPEGNGIHDYPWSVKLLKVMLDNSNVADQVRVGYHLDGFPRDPSTLDDADTILVISDGRDGDLFEEAPHFASPENLALIERQIRRGCGFAVIHFSTFGPDKYAPQSFEWTGGYFDWEENGQRKWYSAIETREAEVKLATPEHPVLRGVAPFKMKEEFYFNIRFAPEDKTVVPLWLVPDLPGRDERGKVVAWAKERPGGGRGFATTCGHFYSNWEAAPFRTMVLNALVWTAGLTPPEGGVQARYYSRPEITAALAGVSHDERAVFKDEPIRVLLLAGNEAHAWHNWKATTPRIQAALELDPRVRVDVSHDPEDLGRDSLKQYQVIVQNYCNWHDGKPLSDRARTGFADFVSRGGGLILIHFANGAWNFSLPMAGESDWPEYRRIVRRVWNHHGKGEAQSGHDAFGEFQATPTRLEHVLTRGLAPFSVVDELYYRQDGQDPIEPLLTAHSKDTKRDEPLAWTYHYGEGRVFQTLLGHSEKTYDAFEAREMLRRAAVWCAGKAPMELTASLEAQLQPADAPQAAAPAEPQPRLVDGRFGAALNAAAGGASLPEAAELRDAPLTVECWVKLDNKEGFNILVASEAKSSSTHWELYSYAGSGVLSAYLPGRGGEYKSDVSIADGKWRRVGMQLSKEEIALFVDGAEVLRSKLKGDFVPSNSGVVAVGRLVEGGIGCAGLIDELHIRRGVQKLTAPSDAPAKLEESTLILWRFDELRDGKLQDESPAGRHEGAASPPPAPAPQNASLPAPKEGHWSHAGVGFGWQESDSADDRWSRTRHGRWLASILPLESGVIAKGLTLRLGPEMELCAAYDTQSMNLRGVWTGGFLRFDPARYGIIAPPRPDGEMQWEAAPEFGWGDAEGKPIAAAYRAFHPSSQRSELEYDVADARVREAPWTTRDSDGKIGLVRELQIGPHQRPLALWLAIDAEVVQGDGEWSIVERRTGKTPLHLKVYGEGLELAQARVGEQQRVGLRLPASDAAKRVQIRYGFGAPPGELTPGQLAAMEKRVYQTKGERGVDGDSAFVLDRLTLPFENEDKSLFFVTGHDFLAPGKMAISTLHGDVWIVSGVDDDLEELTWTRCATGLFQPLGLRIRDGRIYVLGRDQITRLIDEDKDDVAEHYECFCNHWETPTGGHDYATCLETDSHGNFYFLDAVQGLQRVSADGQRVETIATGLRNPNGMGISPRDEITVAPQEGEWTPASFVAYARKGDHFGYLGPRVAPERPLGYTLPLIYLSRRIDNSCGGQVWVPEGAWGGLSGKMLHLSFGQCRMLVVHEENVGGVRQGGAATLPMEFDSGVMRGRFSPFDGALYVSGSRGWVSRAAQDGCLTRVRYRSQSRLPLLVDVKSKGNGFVLQFDGPLDRRTAVDPGGYRIEAWNYRYSAAYGSRDYRLLQPDEEGHDEIPALSATLSEDGQTLSLRTPPLSPANQVQIEMRLRSADGKPLRQVYLHTLHAASSEILPDAPTFDALAAAGLSQSQLDNLQTGLLWTFRSGNREDIVARRMAALSIEAGEPPTALLKAGPFEASARGWLTAPFSDEYAFQVEGTGRVELAIGSLRWSGELREGAPVRLDNIRLTKGPNPISIWCESDASGAARLRVLWKGEGFPWEPLPPTALFHLPSPNLHQRSDALQILSERQCAACHSPSSLASTSRNDLQGWFASPSLKELSGRLYPEWITAWIANPKSLRPNARMPHLLHGERAAADAADITAYLLREGAQKSESSTDIDEAAKEEQIRVGGRLFETLGCLSCHRLTPPEEEDPFNRIPLHHVAAKFTPEGLRNFLQHPMKYAPASRMPDFHLSSEEAVQLAQYLRSQTEENRLPKPSTTGDPKRGEARFAALRCANCHDSTATAAPPASVPLRDLQQGCLSPLEEGPVRFGFAEDEKNALRALLQRGDGEINWRSKTDNLALLMKSYRCQSCHDRDLAVAPRRAIIEEEGESGQPAPPLPNLTWTGDKLRPDWLARYLAGEIAASPRPWLPARMPRFHAVAEPLAHGFAAEHGRRVVDAPPLAKKHPAPDRAKAELGFRLTAQNQLDCRQCHAIGSLQPRGDEKSQIALGINFALTRDRLYADFYERFLLDPPRYDLATRMPKLAEEGRTRAAEILDGDAQAQFDAIWQFILTIPPSEPK